VKPYPLCLGAALLLSTASAYGQGAPKDDKPAAEEAGAEVKAGPTAEGADASGDKAKAADPNAPKPEGEEEKFGTTVDGAKAEAPNKTKYYLGARFRDFIVPSFMFRMFVDGGPGAVNVFSGGPELMVQMGSLEAIISITIPYADFSMNEFVFKSKADPNQAYELVSSSLKLITASVDLLGRIKFDKRGTVALLLGGGVGISGVAGDIRRSQAYPDDPDAVDPETPSKWHKCSGPGDPGTQTPEGIEYCGDDNDHYPSDGEDWSEPYWSDGGSKPVIFPYLALPHIAIEITPVEQFMLRVDTGFSITGFFFGLAAGGKLPI
jgi:hypothetical protein